MGVRDEAGRSAEARVNRGSSRDPLVGTVINGKFHVERAIARGGMGRIYYGRQAPLDRPVALKIVKADSVNEDESQFLKRFLLEASILAKLQHPNVVTLFDYGRIEGAPVEMYFIAMEYLNGETLTERLRARGTLVTTEVLPLAQQIARGLKEAHSRGILHRDLKPSNIVIVPEANGGEIVKLVDFGIGKDEGTGEEDLTREGVLVGTPKYMAPEQFDGISSAASDVYSLGVILYQGLSGVLPFAGTTPSELMMAKLQDPVQPIRELNPNTDVSDDFESLVQQMLSRRPDDRPTLDEVFAQLAFCEEELIGASGARLAPSRPRIGLPLTSRPMSLAALLAQDSKSTVLDGPVTEIAPIETFGDEPLTLSPISSRVVPAIPTMTGLTPLPPRPPTTAPVRADRPAPATVSRSTLIGFALCLVVLAALWIVRAGPTTAAPDAHSPVSAVSPAPLPAASFLLHLDSTPSGAVVLENGHVLGVTPLTISVDRAGVADSTTRAFQLKKEGYTTVAFAQGNADSDVRHVVPLSLDPSATKSTATTPTPSRTPVAPRASGPESDIRPER
jgi:serine/threonine protein kinase